LINLHPRSYLTSLKKIPFFSLYCKPHLVDLRLPLCPVFVRFARLVLPFSVAIPIAGAVAVARQWEESSPKLVQGKTQQVRLRSFSTKIHSVATAVTYKALDDDL